jgi:peptidoglycan hydrolase CwlO-like protein
MNTSIILLQSASSAMLEIALLILGAALIAFFTAWYYQKSYFTPIIKGLETDKENLNRKIADLGNEINTLKGMISDLEKTVSEKTAEIEKLKKPKKQAI